MSSVRVLVGTRKGAFVLTADGKRERWDVSGPFFGGWVGAGIFSKSATRSACSSLPPKMGPKWLMPERLRWPMGARWWLE